jgi:hypothetical protein
MPDASHPLYRRFQLLEIKYLYPEYEEQKALLEALHEKDGTDIFVGSYVCVQKKDGSLFSYGMWGRGVDTLLPKANKVVFGEGDGNVVAAGDWDHVVSVVGQLMEATEHYPPRFRVREFPNASQLAAIGNLE